jgi:hypothetical protein
MVLRTHIAINNLLEGPAPQGKCCPFFSLHVHLLSFRWNGFELSLNLNLFVYRLSRMEISVHPPKTPEFSQDLLTKKIRNQNEAFKMS